MNSAAPTAGGDVRLSILIPVRNETINLRIMIQILGAVVAVPHELIVVYDTPDDDSVAVVRELGHRHDNLRGVLNDRGRGIINALRAGVEAARGEAILIFAADEVGPVLAIEEMLELMDEGCEFVSCTRYRHGGRRLGGSIIGGLLSRAANGAFRRMAGCALSDATTGVKLFRRQDFCRFGLAANPVGWAVAFEMAIKAQLLGLRLGEVPIISIDRLYGGKSTFRLSSWVIEYLRWFSWGILTLRRSPVSRTQARVKLPRAWHSRG